ncbi:MAG: hypothetical protein EOM40_15335 [Clostridia bacterium]|nr:hypothetical protein [Clostridia bacterium]NCC43582.1 hypothetical protein [Clostridia bacterium]
MYEEIEKYLEDTITNQNTAWISQKERENIINFVLRLRQIGLITEAEHKKWQEQFEGMLGTSLSNICFSGRVKNALNGIGIQTYGQLRELLIHEVQHRSFFFIRNVGARGREEIVRAALKYNIVKWEELGSGYVERKDIQGWARLMEKIRGTKA